MPVHLRVQKRQIELEVQFRKSNLQFQPTESVKRFASEFLKSATRIARERGEKKVDHFVGKGRLLPSAKTTSTSHRERLAGLELIELVRGKPAVRIKLPRILEVSACQTCGKWIGCHNCLIKV